MLRARKGSALGLVASSLLACQSAENPSMMAGDERLQARDVTSVPDGTDARSPNVGEFDTASDLGPDTSADASPETISEADTSSDASDGGADANATCCPRDPNGQIGCVRLGGPIASGCFATCDFFCSTNWRVERDKAGCEVWRYDVRAPAAGENVYCFPVRDASPQPSD